MLPFQDLILDQLTGDGSGKLQVTVERKLYLAQDHMRTHIHAELVNQGTVYLPLTTYVERNLTNEGSLFGVQHLYTPWFHSTAFIRSGTRHNNSLQNREVLLSLLHSDVWQPF